MTFDIDKILMNNSRLSIRKIARMLKLSPGTVQVRIKRLEDLGIIRKYTIDIDLEKLGYQFPVLIDIKVSGGKLKEVEERLKDEENVSAVYDITGEYDITIIARFRNRHDLDNFVKKLQTLENVERTHTKLILNVVCENSREGYLNELYKEVA